MILVNKNPKWLTNEIYNKEQNVFQDPKGEKIQFFQLMML